MRSEKTLSAASSTRIGTQRLMAWTERQALVSAWLRGAEAHRLEAPRFLEEPGRRVRRLVSPPAIVELPRSVDGVSNAAGRGLLHGAPELEPRHPQFALPIALQA